VRHAALVVMGASAVAPLLADGPILPISGTDYLSYDMRTGEVTPATIDTRYGPPLWSCSYDYVNYFMATESGEMWLDWGDIAGPAGIGGFSFAEFTNSQASDGDLYAMIAIYAEENGWNSTGRRLVALYRIDNIPASDHPPNEYWGHIWGVDVAAPFVLDGSDLDADGLVDWGYAQLFSVNTPGALHGAALCDALLGGDPNDLGPVPPECPGAEDAFDLFLDPNWTDDPNLQEGYVATYWFACGGCVFAQLYFELYAPQCPNRGESGRYCHADIDGSFDCLVNLADLAQLLGHYGMTTGAQWRHGDIDPYDPYFPGDGDVDLGDLAELLSQYGDDCSGA
jgi:hypothetical protein